MRREGRREGEERGKESRDKEEVRVRGVKVEVREKRGRTKSDDEVYRREGGRGEREGGSGKGRSEGERSEGGGEGRERDDEE